MPAKTTPARKPETRALTVTFDASLWNDIEQWISEQTPKPSQSRGVAALAQRGINAITLPPDLMQAVDRRRSELPYEPTRNQVIEALLRAGLGQDINPQADLNFGPSRPLSR
jgi:hypothetical protein